MKGPTPYVESNALLAIQLEDFAEAERLVRSLLPGERRELEMVARYLADLCRQVEQRESDR